jgi:hypothetical protein
MINFFTVQSFFAGTWDLIWHQGLGIGAIICLLLASYFSPIAKKDLFYAAMIVGAFLLAEDLGIHDESKHVAAQEQVLDKKITSVVKKAKSPKMQAAHDPWNSPNN